MQKGLTELMTNINNPISDNINITEVKASINNINELINKIEKIGMDENVNEKDKKIEAEDILFYMKLLRPLMEDFIENNESI